MAAWVPEMPGCVDLKGSLKEHQRHSTDAYLRNYCKWNWPFEAMTKLRNDRLTAASLNPSNLHLLCHVPWARASKSPTFPPSSTAHKFTKADKGVGGGFTGIHPLKQAVGAETASQYTSAATKGGGASATRKLGCHVLLTRYVYDPHMAVLIATGIWQLIWRRQRGRRPAALRLSMYVLTGVMKRFPQEE